MKPDAIIDEARDWIGTPFVHQGTCKGVGADCLGFVYGVAKGLGLVDCALPAYSREPTGDKLERGISEYLDRVRDLRVGDVMVFKFAKYAQHVGVYTGDTVIHSYSTVGRVVEHRMDDIWRRRHVATFRFRGLDV